MNITSEKIKDILVIHIHEDHLDSGNVDAFRKKVTDLLQDNSDAIFDLQELQFLDSSGLGAFLSSMRILSSKGGALRVCNTAPRVLTLFELVRLQSILDIHNSLEEALKAFDA